MRLPQLPPAWDAAPAMEAPLPSSLPGPSLHTRLPARPPTPHPHSAPTCRTPPASWARSRSCAWRAARRSPPCAWPRTACCAWSCRAAARCRSWTRAAGGWPTWSSRPPAPAWPPATRSGARGPSLLGAPRRIRPLRAGVDARRSPRPCGPDPHRARPPRLPCPPPPNRPSQAHHAGQPRGAAPAVGGLPGPGERAPAVPQPAGPGPVRVPRAHGRRVGEPGVGAGRRGAVRRAAAGARLPAAALPPARRLRPAAPGGAGQPGEVGWGWRGRELVPAERGCSGHLGRQRLAQPATQPASPAPTHPPTRRRWRACR